MGQSPDTEAVVLARTSDLGDGFMVRRALPSAARRMVGPFVFLDEMGPVIFDAGHGLDVRPHPHIGLATVTFLIDGEILHRDSLGTVMPIRPGEVNWMTAGRGIVHSERTPPDVRRSRSTLAGLQVWVALPRRFEEAAPAFAHHSADVLPRLNLDGHDLTLIVGDAYESRSPVEVCSPMFYVDARLLPGRPLPLPRDHAERAAYVMQGEVRVGSANEGHGPGSLIVFAAEQDVALHAGAEGARVMLLGGEPMDGPRFVWWNFVSSSRDLIEQAKADWQARRFAEVPEESEFVPLPPSRRPAPRSE
jgi:redox-sensitive bicupin YhaK (pirin superfamily)